LPTTKKACVTAEIVAEAATSPQIAARQPFNGSIAAISSTTAETS
jgi:hypothetical protein